MNNQRVFDLKQDNISIFDKFELDSTVSKPVSAIPKNLQRRIPLRLPNISEAEVARHYTKLSTLNYGVDSGIYPLGSCTMKYNLKILEKLTADERFLGLHPLQAVTDIQGLLSSLYLFEQYLCEIFGYSRFTLQPAAGSHGELTGLLIIRAYLKDKGQEDRDVILIPDSAHGTNPASAVLAGFKVKKVATDTDGNVSIESLEKELKKHKVAGLMLTNPSTLGLFEENILKISEMVHKAGGLLYYDGANANAMLGYVRPGDMGFDVCHLNLHKTFGTPHGGGGPGSGPVGVKDFLVPYLPNPLIKTKGEDFILDYSSKQSIGRVHGYFGNVTVVLKALVYVLLHGKDGLKKVCEKAIINANYLQSKIKEVLNLPYDRYCMHEFVVSAAKLKKKTGISALDIAKRLIDYNIHPPTIYFPLIVSECLMIEPTETENKKTLDEFIDIIKTIVEEAEKTPDIIKKAPSKRVVSRLDEAKAVKESKLTCFDSEAKGKGRMA